MDTISAILSRRSTRAFLATAVEKRKVQLVLRAAMYAPSAANEQPWQFVVIDERPLMERIRTVHPYAAMLKSAPLAILVLGDLSLERVAGNWVLDCCCAAENLLLAAHDLGLGAVWTGIYPERDRMRALGELCGVPEQVVPLALIAMGYPAATPHAEAERFHPERVRHNSWQVRYEFGPS